jgi:Secreted protein acidic and rich in cysteine Ca binding region/EF hand
MKNFALIALAGATALSVPVLAQTTGQSAPSPHADHRQPMTLAAIEARIKTEFARVDANSDGFIAREEAAAQREKRMAEMRDRHFATLDANKDGTISRAEYDAAHGLKAGADDKGRGVNDGESSYKGPGHHRARGLAMMGDRIFDRADTDKDGRVSLNEALARPTERFKAMDANGDGTVTPDERKSARDRKRMEWRQKAS